LSILSIRKEWIRKGLRPIRTFIENIHGVDRDKYELSFYDITHTIKCHNDLNEFWIAIQDPLKNDLVIDPTIGMEIVDLIKSLERGYMARREQLNQSIVPIDFSYYFASNGNSKFGDGISYFSFKD